MAKDLMLLTGAHPVHRRFGDSCDATTKLRDLAAKGQPAPLKALNLLRSSLSVPSGYGYVVCESCYYYPALKRRMGLLGKTKIINLGCGPVFYHLLSGRISGLERKTLLELLKDVDGHLVYGTYGLELLARLKQQKPGRRNLSLRERRFHGSAVQSEACPRVAFHRNHRHQRPVQQGPGRAFPGHGNSP